MSSLPAGRSTPTDPLEGIQVFERGWLSSNNVLVHAAPGEAGAVLVDTGHVLHAGMTTSLVQRALAGRPLALVVNTHLHGDHCGGNAALARAFGAPLAVPPGQAEAARRWDEDALGYREYGQRIERFGVQRVLDETLRAGGRDWQVLRAPGHDPHSVMLFDPAGGVLLSADALWENGFGLVFPELFGGSGFDEVAEVLDRIAALPVRLVVPGHGAPFTDVAAALQRARSRLAGFRADPARHARHALKVMLTYHVMEERREPREAVVAWAAATPLLHGVWERFAPQGVTLRDWVMQALSELVAQGALGSDGDDLFDR